MSLIYLLFWIFLVTDFPVNMMNWEIILLGVFCFSVTEWMLYPYWLKLKRDFIGWSGRAWSRNSDDALRTQSLSASQFYLPLCWLHFKALCGDRPKALGSYFSRFKSSGKGRELLFQPSQVKDLASLISYWIVGILVSCSLC